MPRRVFYSFHYALDSWRASQVRNMGRFDSQTILTGNKWEEVKRQGDQAVKNWIGSQLQNKSCLLVLIGKQTAERRWVNYEIRRAWEEGRGVLGVYVHGLKDYGGQQTTKGKNPFGGFTIQGVDFAKIAPAIDTPYSTSSFAYGYISDNIADWVENAIEVRRQWP